MTNVNTEQRDAIEQQRFMRIREAIGRETQSMTLDEATEFAAGLRSMIGVWANKLETQRFFKRLLESRRRQ